MFFFTIWAYVPVAAYFKYFRKKYIKSALESPEDFDFGTEKDFADAQQAVDDISLGIAQPQNWTDSQ